MYDLVAALAGVDELWYWSERGHEVDFVGKSRRLLTAIEVMSGAARKTLPGMDAFAATCRPKRRLLVYRDGIPVGEVLSEPVEHSVT